MQFNPNININPNIKMKTITPVWSNSNVKDGDVSEIVCLSDSTTLICFGTISNGGMVTLQTSDGLRDIHSQKIEGNSAFGFEVYGDESKFCRLKYNTNYGSDSSEHMINAFIANAKEST